MVVQLHWLHWLDGRHWIFSMIWFMCDGITDIVTSRSNHLLLLRLLFIRKYSNCDQKKKLEKTQLKNLSKIRPQQMQLWKITYLSWKNRFRLPKKGLLMCWNNFSSFELCNISTKKIFFLSKNLLPSFLLIFLLNFVCAVSYELWSEKCLKSAKKYKQYLCVQIIWWYHILYCPCLLCFAIYLSVHYYSVKRLLQQRKREGKK